LAALNLHHLRLFRGVAVDGTLTGAAHRLNLSQSALSTQIKALEASLGHDLFERRGRGLILTEAGRIALDHAEAIFRTADDLTATLRETGRGRRALRVGALATLSRNFQMQFLRPLIGRPDVEVVLRSGSQAELLRGLESLAFDVVLTNLAPPRDAATPWLVHRLAEQRIGLIGTPLRLGPAPRPVEDLLRHEPLLLPPPDTATRAAFDALTSRLGIAPVIAAEVEDMAMLRLLAREDAGLAVIPPIVVQDELAAGLLVEAARLDDVAETFLAVTATRRFPNPLLAEVLAPGRFR
jgi:LysR family transcriptional regulator, transcriptional activator of nhaA